MNNTLENSNNSNSGFSCGKDENQILINKEGHNEDALTSLKPLGFHESSLIDIESNCCNFNNNQRNTRRKIINISIILMNLITLAGIITLLIKK